MDTLLNELFNEFSTKNATKCLYMCRSNGWLTIGDQLGDFISNYITDSIPIHKEIALISYESKNFRKAYKHFRKCISLEREPKLIDLVRDNIGRIVPMIENDFTDYPTTIIGEICERSRNPIDIYTFTITTCKRLQLFKKTMNSFINCCIDIDKIDRWICVDDQSSEEDKSEMKRLYPFFQFYWKTPDKKGHSESMNIIHGMVQTPFLFHMEDDWSFYEKRPYISLCTDVLLSDSSIGQCLINKNYGETNVDWDVSGGHKKIAIDGSRYWVHEYVQSHGERQSFNKRHHGKKNSSYWPHFSFRPSLLKTSIFKKIGLFNDGAAHFEQEYGYRYVENGFKSAFLDGLFCKHTGRLTSERSDCTKLNAYQLNGETQFTKNTPVSSTMVKSPNRLLLKMFCVNLCRRGDRWDKMQSHSDLKTFNMLRRKAVDGDSLNPKSLQLQRIFENNDYKMRSGIVGCAMSHLQLCTELIYDSNADIYCILEDDIQLVPSFTSKFLKVIQQLSDVDWDIAYLGHHLKKPFRDYGWNDKLTNPVIEKWDARKSLTMSLGGTGGYLLSTRGAKRFLQYVNKNGMTNGIDTMQQKSADALDVYYCTPHLIYSDCWDYNNSADTDIQSNFKCLDISTTDRIDLEKQWWYESGNDFVIVNGISDALPYFDILNKKVVIFTSTDKIGVENAKVLSRHPWYIVSDLCIVIVPESIKDCYFERTMKNGRYDVSDAVG